MMMNSERVVLDTNVLVSAALTPNSTAQKVLEKALKDCVVLQSIATLSELKEVLERRKFDKYISHDDRQRFLRRLVASVELVEITV
jgi:putative PIN family toxin of toxin-antitoxin system